MTPLPSVNASLRELRDLVFGKFVNRSVGSQISTQWREPHDVLSILMILGPDIVQRALAQLSGSYVAPVVFSFGWVAYAFSALLSAFGNGRLIPDADYAAIIIGAKSGHQRNNKSWIVGRLLRDHEHRSPIIKHRDDKAYGAHEALRVTVFQVAKSQKSGTISRDWIYYSGFLVMVIQLLVASIPLILDSNWTILIITAAGTILALFQGAMPQWKREKWACPKNGGYTVSITQGNGSRHVMVILGDEHHGLDLEILASGSKNLAVSRWELVYISILTACWTALLISVAGLSEDSWYLLAVGLIGIVHNIFVAGAPRHPGALGIHLEEKEVISSNKVADVLFQTEQKYPLVGSSLVDVFFSGGMRVSEDRRQFWAKAEELRTSIGLDSLRIKTDV